jgi:hypothetical protein
MTEGLRACFGPGLTGALMVAVGCGGVPSPPQNAGPDPSAAIRSAQRDLGISGQERVLAQFIPLGGETLPFLQDTLQGKKTWRIEFDKPRWPGLDLPGIPSLVVLLEPERGHVMRVDSPWPGGQAPPPVFVEQRQLTAQGERFTRLPAERPPISLARALRVVAANGGNLGQAKQLIAYYVARQTPRDQGRPVWIIQIRGLPPFEAGGPGVPVEARNHLRHVIDAGTGRWLGADSLPQPENP